MHELDLAEDRLIKSKIYLAKIAVEKEEFDEAFNYLNEVELVTEQKKHPKLSIIIKIEKISLFSIMNQYSKALILIDDTIDMIGNDKKFLRELEYLYYIQSSIYNSLQQSEKELQSIKKHIEVKKQIDSINNKFNIESLKLSFKQERAQKEILQQQKLINTLKDKEKIKSKNTILIISILICTIIFLSIFFYKQQKLNSFIRRNWEAEKKIKELKEAYLEVEVNAKKQQLTDMAIHISEKNELLEKIKTRISNLGGNDASVSIKDLLFFINEDIKTNKEKYLLYNAIDNTNDSFYKNLSNEYPELNEKEKKIATLIRLGNSSKQISLQLGIAKSSVNNYRYNLRKKFNLSRDQSLTAFIKKL